MCLITKQKKAKIAQENIIIYKVLYKDGKKFIASNFMFEYVKGNTYKTPIQKINWTKGDIRWPNYVDKELTKEAFGESRSMSALAFVEESKYTVLGPGFHSCSGLRIQDYIDSIIDNRESDRMICKFIIPKGAKYFTDGFGNYCSDQITFKTIVTPNRWKSLK